jgi:hypothetical protein
MLLDETTIKFILLLAPSEAITMYNYLLDSLNIEEIHGLDPRLHSYPAITNGANFLWFGIRSRLREIENTWLRKCY